MHNLAFLQSVPGILWVKWACLVCILAAMLVWHVLDYAHTRKRIFAQQKNKSLLTDYLLKKSFARSVQLLILAVFLVFSVGWYDVRLLRAHMHIADMPKPNELPLFAQQQPPVAPDVDAPPALPADVTESLFSPGEGKTPDEMEYSTSLDHLKARYEELIVTFLYLRECGMATDKDYATIMSMLAHEMRSLEASPKMQENILSAAKGSYEEIYRGSPCEGAAMEATKEGFLRFLDHARSKLAAK